MTYPGAYHGGFSTGLNIGEAVNFATKSWFNFGMKCQKIYRASRERIPVFPIEWVLVENIRNLKTLELGLDELTNIKDCYEEYYAREIESRKLMEGKIINHFNKKGQDGEKILQERISYIENRDEVDED